MTTPSAARSSHCRLDRVQAAVERRLAQHRQIALQTHHDGLRLRIAEPAVELDDVRRPVRRNHDAGVQKSRVRHSVGGQSANRGLDHLTHDAGMDFRRGHGSRRVGAHAAGVGSAVAVVEALVVLRGRQRQHMCGRRP